MASWFKATNGCMKISDRFVYHTTLIFIRPNGRILDIMTRFTTMNILTLHSGNIFQRNNSLDLHLGEAGCEQTQCLQLAAMSCGMTNINRWQLFRANTGSLLYYKQ